MTRDHADQAIETPTAGTGDPVPVLLCVDDEPNILAALKRVFRPDGYRILTATSGAAALELLESQPVDLIVSDMRMPEMDGAEFLAQVAVRWPAIMRLLLTGYADMDSTIAAINDGRIYQYLRKPWDDHELRIIVQKALRQQYLEREKRRLLTLTRTRNNELNTLNAELEQRVTARTAELQETADFLDLAYAELKRGYADTVEVFAGLLELRDQTGSGHGRRVAAHCRAIGTRLELNEQQLQNLAFAALLHDIGKISLPDHLLTTPRDTLTAAERTQYEMHPLTSERVLIGVEPLQEAALLARHHHERYDGRGYPDALAGTAIPLGARILAAANDFDGLQCGMVSENFYSDEEARSYLRAGKGTLYDPHVVDALLEVVEPATEQPDRSGELRLPSSALRPGMQLARDLVHFDGVLLLRAGHELKDHLIVRIREFERQAGRSYTVHIVRN